MNKKFSTLVASVLLAGAVGTVNAAVPYKSYVNSAALAEDAVKAVVNGVAYQISDGENVLVMQEQNDGTMKLVLQNPSKVEVDLLSSLWEVATSDDGEGGVSFIFLNKATGLPLAFGTEGVKENTTTANAMGNVSLWKWKSGTAIEGEANFVSYFHKDSAMVLVTNGTSVEAKKIYSKGTDLKIVANKLSADAYVAQPVVLDADALNSMLGLQDPKTGKMKLGFTRDQLNGSDNLWLKDMKAVASTFDSPSKHGSIPVYYTEDEQNAANTIKELVANLDKSGLVTDVIKATGSSYADDKKAVYLDVLSEVLANGGVTFNSAAEVVDNKKAFYENANKVAIAQATLADDINTKVIAFPEKGTVACSDLVAYNGNLGKDKFGTAVSLEGGDPANVTDVVTALNAIAGVNYTLADAQAQTKTLAAVFTAINDAVKDLDVASAAELVSDDAYNTYVDAIIDNAIANTTLRTSLKTAANATGSTDAATKKTNAKAMADYATLVSNAAQTFEATAIAAISTEGEWNAAIGGIKAELPLADYADLDQTAYDKVFAAMVWTNDLTASKTAVAGVKDGYTSAKTTPAAQLEAATALNDAVVAKNVKATVVGAINAAKPSGTEEVVAVYTAVSTAADAAEDNLISAIAAATTKADVYSEVKEWQGTVDNSYLSLITKANTDPTKVEYLRVDTAFLTKDAGKKHLAFATGVYKADLKGSDKNSVDAAVQADYNGRYNFKFTYYPTQDSLMIKADGFAHPRTDKYYADMDASEINASRALHAADNNVKLAVLSTDKHHEVTLGDIETIETSKLSTINTRIYLNGSANYERTTLESGVYFFNLVTKDAKKKDNNGKYCVIPYCGEGNYAWEAIESTQRFGAAQDFNHMPRTQWVVEQNEGVDGVQTVKITNREFDDYTSNYIQLYKAGDYYFTMSGDTVAAQKVADKYTTDKYLGYKKFEKA